MGDNAERVPCPEIIVFGNHDLECRDRVVALPFPEDDIRTAKGKMASHLEDLVSKIPGSMVENKDLMLSVHHRQAEGRAILEIKRAVWNLVSKLKGLCLVEGKKILELRPDIPLDKGRAVMAF